MADDEEKEELYGKQSGDDEGDSEDDSDEDEEEESESESEDDKEQSKKLILTLHLCAFSFPSDQHNRKNTWRPNFEGKRSVTLNLENLFFNGLKVRARLKIAASFN